MRMRRAAWVAACLLLAAPGAADIHVNELLGRAERGDAEAQTLLGFVYLRGEHVVPDTAVAAQWFLRAAQQGDFTARYALGTLLCPTCVPAPDYAEAAKRFRAAAEHGSPLAQTNLAMLLAEGRGAARNPVEALMWYEIAARAPQEGVAMLAERQRAVLAARLSPQQVDEARSRAAAFKPRR